MTLSSGVYTVTAKTPVRVTGASCDLPIGTIIATFSSTGTNTYSGQHGLWYTSNCSFGIWDNMTLTLSGDGNTLTAVLDQGYGTVTFTKTVAPTVQILKVDPHWAPFTGGVPITITGTNFGTSPKVEFRDNCFVSIFFQKPATVISATPTKIVVTAPSTDSPAQPQGLYNAAAVNGPSCIIVSTPGGTADTGHTPTKESEFTYVVPEIGELVYHHAVPDSDGKTISGCTAEAVQSANRLVVLTAGHCVFGADQFAFAPGYFGAPMEGCKSSSGTTSSFLSCGTAPYGIWCVNDPSDNGCDSNSMTAKNAIVVEGDKGFAKNPNLLDYGFLLTEPRFIVPLTNPVTLGDYIGGGLAITFGKGNQDFAIRATQNWHIVGYASNGYLDTCAPQTMLATEFGNPPLPIPNSKQSALFESVTNCSFIRHGSSGSPWMNDQNNGETYGIGAVQDTANGDGGIVTGAYLGSAAENLWRQVENRR